jgi:hypothetical protein
VNDVVTPQLVLETLVMLDGARRSTTTREPGETRAASFMLVRGAQACAWAINADVTPTVASELDALAREEPAGIDWHAAPLHGERYRALLAAERVTFGPSFRFPERVNDADTGTCIIEDERLLSTHFRGWVPGEIAAGRAPVVAIVVDGAPVSVCFCARLNASAAEAGVETAVSYRGRGFAPRVTAAWARAVRERGIVPLYSTSWENRSSLAVARTLGLVMQANIWSC